MKKLNFLVPLALLATLASCNRTMPYRGPVVEQTYVHQYGVQVPPEQWQTSGETGQIVSKLKSGVVVTNTYAGGVLDGETNYTFPHNDNIQKVETYTDGRLIKEIHHSITGTPMKETFYQDHGVRHVTIWYEDGTPQAKEVYVKGRLTNGQYFDHNQQVEAKVENGQGNRINRDNYGMLESNDTIFDGDMTQRTTYHVNGHPKEVIPYANGVVSGERRTYLPAGEPNTIEMWELGMQHGTTIVFSAGEKVAEVPYVSGMKQGLERRYRNGRTVVEEITWTQDQRQGPTYTYVGENKKTDWYHNGRRVTKGAYDLNMNPNRS